MSSVVSRAGTEFTPPTSCAPSECGSNVNYRLTSNYRNPEELADTISRSPHPRPAGLRRTQSFRPVPSSLPEQHTVTNDDPWHRVGSPTIDEASPDEDERFAEPVIRNERKSSSLSPSTYSSSALNSGIPENITTSKCNTISCLSADCRGFRDEGERFAESVTSATNVSLHPFLRAPTHYLH